MPMHGNESSVMKIRIRRFLEASRLYPNATMKALGRWPAYLRAYRKYLKLAGSTDQWPLKASFPCLLDATDAAGTASGHYFHQDLLVAQRIFARAPGVHYDVGSRIDGFVAHVAAFRTIVYFDVRPIASNARNMSFRPGNLLVPDSLPARSCDSLSCLHVIEHIGLGRYGDPLVPDGWRLAMRSLAQMLQPNGRLYLSVPIGRQRIEFNAHRIFAPSTIVSAARDLGLGLDHFAWVDDSGALHDPPLGSAEVALAALDVGAGCGIFEFIRTDERGSDRPVERSNLPSR